MQCIAGGIAHGIHALFYTQQYDAVTQQIAFLLLQQWIKVVVLPQHTDCTQHQPRSNPASVLHR